MCAPTVFISRFLVWRCEVLVVMTRKVFWNAYRQKYVKTLRNRPFSPQIICKNLWFGLAKNFTNHTIFLHRFFSHKLTQIPTNNHLVESRGICVSGSHGSHGSHRICTPNVKSHRGLRQLLEAYLIRFSHLFYPFKPDLHRFKKSQKVYESTGQRAIGYGGLKNNCFFLPQISTNSHK